LDNYIIINNNKYNLTFLDLKLNIIDFCLKNNFLIPRFCYHYELSIAGNCRMCLIEITDSIKPIASCAMLVRNKLNIFTKSYLIKKSREYILEFILINHPLDCPVCDQGGECDLQDQALLFGNDRSRFYEQKKITLNKKFNSFIKTIMTRCIHCTRCIRFLNDLNLNFDLGMLGRGYNMEIGSYIEKNSSFELLSNIIDLCPVGALTSKTYAFKARPWELYNFKSFDIFETIGSTISICIQGIKILRILPYNNESINNSWLNDRIRYFYDSLYNQRLLNPYQYSKKLNKFIIINWYSFFKFLFFLKKNFLNLKNLSLLLNLNFLSLNDLCLLKSCYKKNLIIYNLELNFLNDKFFFNHYRQYILNKQNFLKNLKKEKNIILLNNYNLRLKNPILNLEFIKNFKFNQYLYLFSINLNSLKNLNFKNININNNFFINLLKGKNNLNLFFYKNLKINKYKIIIFNNITYFSLKNFKIFNKYFIKNYYFNSNLFELNKFELNIKTYNNNLNYFLNNKNNLNLNIVMEENLNLNYFYYLKLINKFIFNIYLNSHKLYNLNSNSYKVFDFLLPLNLYLENSFTSINLYGILQKSIKINKWLNHSKSFLFFFKFLIFCFKLNFNFKLFYNIKTYIFKNIKIESGFTNNNYFSYFICYWILQQLFMNFYIVNNITSFSKYLLNKDIIKKNFNFI